MRKVLVASTSGVACLVTVWLLWAPAETDAWRRLAPGELANVRGGLPPDTCYVTDWANCPPSAPDCRTAGACYWTQKGGEWDWWCNLNNVNEKYFDGWNYVREVAVGLLGKQSWEPIACVALRDCDVKACITIGEVPVCQGGEIEGWSQYHTPWTADGGQCPPGS